MASFKYFPVPVIEQPLPSGRLSLDTQSPFLGSSEKGFNTAECQHQHFSDTQPCTCEEQWGLDSTSSSPNHLIDHRRCHNGRLRRFLLPVAIISLVLLLLGCAALAFSSEFCLGYGMEMNGLVARASSTTESTFSKKKLKVYLISFFVGSFVVLFLIAVLIKWWCKGDCKGCSGCSCFFCEC